MTANVNVDFVLLGGTKSYSSRNLNVPVKYFSSNTLSANTSTSANCVSPATWSNNSSQSYGHAVITVTGAPVRVTWDGTASNSTYGLIVMADTSVPVEISANTKIHVTEITL